MIERMNSATGIGRPSVQSYRKASYFSSSIDSKLQKLQWNNTLYFNKFRFYHACMNSQVLRFAKLQYFSSFKNTKLDKNTQNPHQLSPMKISMMYSLRL